ncbi:MAG: hypothetical protein RL654_2138 [Pseudomonadota bacterium]
MSALPAPPSSSPVRSDGLRRLRGRALPWAVAIALGLAVLLAARFGAVPVGLDDWLAPLGAETPGAGAHVLWHLRLPRIVFALLVGAGLGLGGALTQALFRNPLADPGLLGVSSGAACAAAMVIVLFAGIDLPLPPAWRPSVLPVAAFCGALLVVFALDRLARLITPGSVAGLLLCGLAINAVAASLIGLATYLATDEQLRSLSFWTLGSLAGASWALAGLFAAVMLPALWQAMRLSQALNALALGEAAAAHVGIEVQRLRGRVIVLVALVCALAVAWCGMIGFVGLIAPHLARTLAGADQRRVLGLAPLIGAGLLLLADTLARTLAMPAEIPVGIFTALLGGPFFVAMLRGTMRRQGGVA